jgi:hypothetical protein
MSSPLILPPRTGLSITSQRSVQSLIDNCLSSALAYLGCNAEMDDNGERSLTRIGQTLIFGQGGDKTML